MATDEERREVARRLRGLDYSDLQESLICAYLDALGIEGYADWVGIAHRLADLIEPSIPKDPGKAGLACVDAFIREMRHSTEEERGEYSAMLKKMSVELHPVDRDALLALADEMEEFGNLPVKHPGIRVLHNDDFSRELGYARRIREALGVSDD